MNRLPNVTMGFGGAALCFSFIHDQHLLREAAQKYLLVSDLHDWNAATAGQRPAAYLKAGGSIRIPIVAQDARIKRINLYCASTALAGTVACRG